MAGLLEVQTVFDEVNTHCTTSPFVGIYVNIGALEPASVPLTFHWYAGLLPGLTGVAVNVTVVPKQTVLPEALIETSTESPTFTVTT